MAALGIVVAATGAVKEESVLEAVKNREASPQPLRKGSEEAFKKGFAAGKALASL
jgi:Pyruvate/2-oxoacid:ferredoxin oxidoreductase gamma subunit